MSSKSAGRVWEYELPQDVALVLHTMADAADHEGGGILIEVGLLAWLTGLPEERIVEVLGELVAARVLVIEEEAGGSNFFFINWAAMTPKMPYVKGKS